MIPISTAKNDPPWYHNYGDNSILFIDKNGVLNGARTEILNTATIEKRIIGAPPQDDEEFIHFYNQEIELNGGIQKFLKELTAFATYWCNSNHINEEPIIVFIVYESPTNPKSEREPLLKFFASRNINCEELKYPINKNYR